MDQERMELYIHSLSPELPDYLQELEQCALAEHVPVIRRPTQDFLRFLLRTKKPVRILEVGAAIGFSSLFMREYTDEGCHITTIEKVPARIRAAEENYRRWDIPSRITLLKGDAADWLKKIAEEEAGTYDFIFMDAAKGQYLSFLEPVLELLPQNGMLVSDNVLQEGTVIESRYAVTRRDRTIHSRMRDYLYRLTHCEELETVILPIGDGLTVSTKLEAKREGENQ